MAARALELTILCATRTNETLGATWDEFDLEAGLWTIPKDRMKAGRAHVIPLAPEAVALLKRLKAEATGKFVFTFSPKVPLSNMAMLTLLRRMKRADITTHGFRRTFSTWANDTGAGRPDVIESCLAHKEGDKVRGAYNDADYEAERRALMAAWANYATGA